MFLQTAADSLANVVGTQVGAQVAVLVALGLGLATKVVVDIAKKASSALAGAPDYVKAVVAVLFGQLAVFVSAKTGVFINPDITMLETTLVGAVVSAVAMGVNALFKSLGWSVSSSTSTTE